MFRSVIGLITIIPWVACAAENPPTSGTDTDFSIGVSGNLDLTPYKSKLHQYSVLPVINYDNDRWYIQGGEGGVYLLNDDSNELKIKAFYDSQQFSPKDMHGALRQLHSRHATMMAGASYQRITPIGAIYTQLAADTLDHSNGLTGNLAWLYQYEYQGWTLVPEIGADWANAQQNRYYYGVSAHESRRSGVARYRPNQSMTPYASLIVDYAFTPHWDTYFSVRAERLAATVRNSPMVGRGYSGSLNLGINYNF